MTAAAEEWVRVQMILTRADGRTAAWDFPNTSDVSIKTATIGDPPWPQLDSDQARVHGPDHRPLQVDIRLVAHPAEQTAMIYHVQLNDPPREESPTP